MRENKNNAKGFFLKIVSLFYSEIGKYKVILVKSKLGK